MRFLYMPRTFTTLYRIVFAICMPFFVLGLLLPVYGKEIGAQVVEIGLFFSAFSIMTVILRPVVGWLLDRYGRKPFLLIGAGGYAVTMLSFAFIDQVWGVIAARMLQGVASSFFWLSLNAITADIAPDEGRGRAFGRLAEANSRGSILGALIGFSILNAGFTIQMRNGEISSWSLLFIIYGGINLLATLYAAWQMPETRCTSPSAVMSPFTWSSTWVLLLTVTLFTGAAWAMTSPIMIIYLQEKLDIGLDVLSWAYLPAGLVWAILPSRLGRIADRFSRKLPMVVALIAASASAFLIPLLSSVIALSALWAFQAMCYAAGDPAEQALVADLTNGDQRGRGYGLYVMMADLGAAIGPFGGAWLYQHVSTAAPFIANGILLAVNALILAAFLKAPLRTPVISATETG